MRSSLVVDTGPIVAWLNRHDQFNPVAEKYFASLPKPLLTCEVVLCECFYILGKEPKTRKTLLEQISAGVLSISFCLADELPSVQSLLDKYQDVPMSLADACLVRMSEIYNAPVFTFDGDFRIYRRNRRSEIPLIGID